MLIRLKRTIKKWIDTARTSGTSGTFGTCGRFFLRSILVIKQSNNFSKKTRLNTDAKNENKGEEDDNKQETPVTSEAAAGADVDAMLKEYFGPMDEVRASGGFTKKVAKEVVALQEKKARRQQEISKLDVDEDRKFQTIWENNLTINLER